MSYIAKKGKAAFESMNEEPQDFSKVLAKFTVGTQYNVRVPSIEDFVEYYAHGVFDKGIWTTPCTKPAGKEDLYDRAVDLLYQDARSTGDSEKSESLRKQARQLSARPRYLLGFFNLADGAEIIVDLSRKQATQAVAAIKNYEKQIDSFAFTIAKGAEGVVSFVPILGLDSLTDAERKHFEATAGKTFDESLYGKVLKPNTEEKQIEDLRKFGFDVSRLGVGEAVHPVADVGEDDLPF